MGKSSWTKIQKFQPVQPSTKCWKSPTVKYSARLRFLEIKIKGSYPSEDASIRGSSACPYCCLYSWNLDSLSDGHFVSSILQVIQWPKITHPLKEFKSCYISSLYQQQMIVSPPWFVRNSFKLFQIYSLLQLNLQCSKHKAQ